VRDFLALLHTLCTVRGQGQPVLTLVTTWQVVTPRPPLGSGQVEILPLCQFSLAAIIVTTLIRRVYLSLHWRLLINRIIILFSLLELEQDLFSTVCILFS
jgi:hypothetical protein